MKNNKSNELLELLKFLYQQAKEEERSLGSRKIQLYSNSIIGLSVLTAFLAIFLKFFEAIAEKIGFRPTAGILIFIFVLMGGFFFVFVFYIRILNKYQRVHYMSTVLLEKRLYETISGKKEKDVIEKIFYLLPLRRFIERLELNKGKRF